MCELKSYVEAAARSYRSFRNTLSVAYPLLLGLLGDVLGQGLFAGNRFHSVMHGMRESALLSRAGPQFLPRNPPFIFFAVQCCNHGFVVGSFQRQNE